MHDGSIPHHDSHFDPPDPEPRCLDCITRAARNGFVTWLETFGDEYDLRLVQIRTTGNHISVTIGLEDADLLSAWAKVQDAVREAAEREGWKEGACSEHRLTRADFE